MLGFLVAKLLLTKVVGLPPRKLSIIQQLPEYDTETVEVCLDRIVPGSPLLKPPDLRSSTMDDPSWQWLRSLQSMQTPLVSQLHLRFYTKGFFTKQ